MKRLFVSLLLAVPCFAQIPAASLIGLPVWQPLDNNGRTVPFGKICTYATGSFNPLATYTSPTGNIQLSNPIILDSAGRANPWWGAGKTYRVVFQQPGNNFCPGTGATIWTKDGVADIGELLAAQLAQPTGSSLIGFEQPGGVASTVAAALAANPLDFQYSSLQAMINATPSGGGITVTGTNTGPITLARPIRLHCDPGMNGVITSASTAQTVLISSPKVSITGCGVSNTGGGSAIGGTGSLSDVDIENNTLMAASGAQGAGINLLANQGQLLSNIKISGNKCLAGTTGPCVNVGGNQQDIEIADNSMDGTNMVTGVTPINSQNFAAGTEIQTRVNIHDNRIVNLASTGSPIQVQSGTPMATPQGVSVSNNFGQMDSDTNALVSVSGVNGAVVCGNHLDLQGTYHAVENLVEMANVSNFVTCNNVLENPPAGAGNTGSLGCNACNNGIISGNVTTGEMAVGVGFGSTSVTYRNVVVSGNVVNTAGEPCLVIGPNSLNQSIQNVVVEGNICTNPVLGTQNAVDLIVGDPPTGQSLTGITITGNQFLGFEYPYNVGLPSVMTGFSAVNNYFGPQTNLTTAGGINSTATSITVANITGFPTTTPFPIAMDIEQMSVTNVSGTAPATLTITRGTGSTTAAAHNQGVTVGSTIYPDNFTLLPSFSTLMDVGQAQTNMVPHQTFVGTSGTATCSMAQQGTQKQVICALNGYAQTGSTQSYPFPTQFFSPSVPPVIVSPSCGTYNADVGFNTSLLLPANAAMTPETCQIVVIGQ